MSTKDLSKHPCFNKHASGQCSRVHLPVAPKCNIKCNYCDRKYDCVNESRPGVSSTIFTPARAAAYVDEICTLMPNLSVVGIAGPGDPLANPLETFRTLELIKESHPDLIFCLSTNGLALPEHVDRLAELDVTHVTVTVNAVDPEIGAEVYGWVRDGKVVYQGLEAARLILSRQSEGIKRLVERDIMVKINSIVIPGVNDHHLEEVARAMAELGADVQNLMPLFPNPATPFGHLKEPDQAMVTALRKATRAYIPQMTHCKRCRADAVGLLGKDQSIALAPLMERCASQSQGQKDRPYVAVASREGLLVNQHLGEAETFSIWELRNGAFLQVAERKAPQPGCGPKRWEALARTLHDCRAVLCAAAGEAPSSILAESGVPAHAVTGFVEDALKAAFAGDGSLERLSPRRGGIAGSLCTGTGSGCG